jgi:hypothetical protein
MMAKMAFSVCIDDASCELLKALCVVRSISEAPAATILFRDQYGLQQEKPGYHQIYPVAVLPARQGTANQGQTEVANPLSGESAHERRLCKIRIERRARNNQDRQPDTAAAAHSFPKSEATPHNSRKLLDKTENKYQRLIGWLKITINSMRVTYPMSAQKKAPESCNAAADCDHADKASGTRHRPIGKSWSKPLIGEVGIRQNTVPFAKLLIDSR